MLKADRYGHSAIFSASINGNLDVVKRLLQVGALQANGGDPLIVAAENQHFQVVRCLLDAGSDEKVQRDESH